MTEKIVTLSQVKNNLPTKTLPNTDRCYLCMFYDDTIKELNEGQGFCRSAPPVVHLVPVQGLNGPGLAGQSIWPIVTGKVDFCGEFEPFTSNT